MTLDGSGAPLLSKKPGLVTHKIWLMHGLRAELAGEAEGCVWVDAQELAALPMPTPMDKYRKELLESGEMKEWKS